MLTWLLAAVGWFHYIYIAQTYLIEKHALFNFVLESPGEKAEERQEMD